MQPLSGPLWRHHPASLRYASVSAALPAPAISPLGSSPQRPCPARLSSALTGQHLQWRRPHGHVTSLRAAGNRGDASSSASFEQRYKLTTSDTGLPDAAVVPSDASSSASFQQRYDLVNSDTGKPDVSALPPAVRDAIGSSSTSLSAASGTDSSTATPGGTTPAAVAAVSGTAAAPAVAATRQARAAAVKAANRTSPPTQFIPHRWRIVWMMAVAFVLCNMDKVNMSVAVIPMARELQWTATERGFVSSSFFWGYSLTQIPAGWVSTKIGGARVLMAGVALWSFGTLLAPPAAQISIYALCASRMLVGLGEGFAPSAATAVMAATVPPTERSRAVTTVFGGLDVGSAVGLLVSGPLIARYGWPSVFYLFAVLGVVWCCLWPLFRPDKEDDVMKDLDECGEAAFPERCSLDSLEDAAASSPDPHVVKPIDVPPINMPWGSFFSSPAVWAVTVAHFCFNWGYYTLLAWLPSYFELALGLDVRQSSFLTLIPYVAMAAMTPLVGPVADGMVQRGVSLTRVRKICQGLAFAGPALCMIACGVLTPQTFAAGGEGAPVALLVVLLSIGFALGAWSRAGLYCNHQDLSPKYAGALLGITNTAGALPGVLGVTAAGMMLDATNSWSMAIFYPTAICQLIGLTIYSIFASSERQNWK